MFSGSSSKHTIERLEERITSLETDLTAAQARISELNQIVERKHSTHHIELNILKQQIAEIQLSLHSRLNDHEQVVQNTTSIKTFNLTLADIATYAKVKINQSPDSTFYGLLSKTLDTVTHAHQLFVLDDYSHIHPSLTTALSVFTDFLRCVSTKHNFDDPDQVKQVLLLLSTLGVPVLEQPLIPGQKPNPAAVTYIVVGYTNDKRQFVSLDGFTKAHILDSALHTYPLSGEIAQIDSWIYAFISIFPVLTCIEHNYLTATTVNIDLTNTTAVRDAIAQMYNFFFHRGESTTTAAPNLTFTEVYYWVLFIAHILFQSALIDQFSLRHPFINHLLDDFSSPLLISVEPIAKFLAFPLFFNKLTQHAIEYNTILSLLKLRLDQSSFTQPEELINQPIEYLRLSANGEMILNYQWSSEIQKLLGLTLIL